MTRGLLLLLVAVVVAHGAVLLYRAWQLRPRGTGDGAPERSFRQRLDETLVDPEAPNGEWSSKRVGWMGTLATFNLLALLDPNFRDPGSYVAIIGILTAVAWGSKLLRIDLTTVLSKAAERIRAGSRTEKTEITEIVEQEPGGDKVDTVEIDAENVHVAEKEARPRRGGE